MKTTRSRKKPVSTEARTKKRPKGPISPDAAVLERLGDDSHLHVRPKPDKLFGPPSTITETIFFTKVGHTFGPAPPDPLMPPSYIVQDFLLDQTGASGNDGRMSATKDFDLTTATAYRFNIFPKDIGRRIKVKPPVPASQVFVGVDVGRRFVNAASDVFDMWPASSFFIDVVGSAPVFTYNYFFIGRTTEHWVNFRVNQKLVSAFTCLGFCMIGSYPQRSFDPGLKSYIPLSFSLPFNLPGPNAVPHMVFSYRTTKSTDPGPFVFL